MMKKANFNKSVFVVILFSVLIIYTLSMTMCYIWGLSTALKEQYYFLMVNKVWPTWPSDWHIDNFVYAFTNFEISISGGGKVDIFLMTLYSVLYAGVSAVIQTFVTCFVAYLVAKFKYKFSAIVYWVVVVAMTIPIVGSDISAIQMLNNFGLYDNFLGIYIQKASFLGMYFLVFHATFSALPNDYSEAACVDGAGEFRTFISIIFPIVINMVFTITLISFITFWNDYQGPILYLPTHPTLAYGVFVLTNSSLNGLSDTPHRLAICMVVALPILVLFLVFKDRIMNSISVGGIKE